LINRALCVSLAFAGLAANVAASPSTASPVERVRWLGGGVVTWERTQREPVEPVTLHRFTVGIAAGTSRILSPGMPGERDVKVQFSQRDGGPVQRVVLSSRIVRRAHPRVVADGIGRTALTSFEALGVARTTYVARSALEMIATAYTAACNGCGGMTAIGRRAGYGIVAVDPRVIPLGTRLFIPGYGFAIAGDTGGAIRGHRIDLGFDSLRDAMLFGRRGVVVYRLK
jgi:3D (Asp-Asp-Asp) domain-containing protein